MVDFITVSANHPVYNPDLEVIIPNLKGLWKRGPGMILKTSLLLEQNYVNKRYIQDILLDNL